MAKEQQSDNAWDRSAMDPRQKWVLDRTLEYRRRGPYRARTSDEIAEMLRRYFDHLNYRDAK
ncbi:MAG: hypothetical protein AB7U34_06570, partial [Novosphingobium sp.]